MDPGMYWTWMLGRRRPDRFAPAGSGGPGCPVEATPRGHLWRKPNAAFRKTAMAQQLEVREGGIGLSLLRERFGGRLRF